MKILFVFTGGTIGSTLDGDCITLDKNKSFFIIESYKKKYGLNADYDVIEPYSELSENNNGLIIRALIDCILSNLNSGYDGIIITHGTDTIQYSASALSYVIGNNSIPICLVSSNYPIDNPKSNGIINLCGAIRFIENSYGKGVWVIYKNNNDCLKIHRATRLLSSKAFSDDIYSIHDQYFGWFDDSFQFHKNKYYDEKRDEMNTFIHQDLEEASMDILKIEPYPGMVYPNIPYNIKYIILGSYHSGTIDVKSNKAKSFFEKILERNIKVFITGVEDNILYESSKKFNQYNIIPVYNISPVSTYIKLWLGSLSGIDMSQTINCSLSGDVVEVK